MSKRLVFCAAVSLLVPTAIHAGLPGTIADPAHREHDEIVIGGQYFHTGVPSVVLWTDPDGFDLSSNARRPVTRPAIAPSTQATSNDSADEDAASPPSAAASQPTTTEAPFRTIRGPDVPLDTLKSTIDQFVIHFDACGSSLECFNVLKRRRLSVQFMLDLDGTLYQAMDAGAAAQHATIANARSIGVEIANLGGFDAAAPMPALIKSWYRRENGSTRIVFPPDKHDGIRTPNFVGHPARPEPVEGVVQGKTQRQYDFTPQQYRTLAKLTATLCTVLPEIKPDFPRQRTALGPPGAEATTQPVAGDPTTQPSALAEPGQSGMLIPHTLSPEQYDAWHGVLGHYHVQFNKDDPGPAFQWGVLMSEVRREMAQTAAAQHRP